MGEAAGHCVWLAIACPEFACKGTFSQDVIQLLHRCSPALPLQVDVYTAFHDPQRCFEETVSGPFSVTVAGGWFPRAIAGRAHALCAYIRCTLCALYVAWLSWRQGRQYDVVIVDQVGNCTQMRRASTAVCACYRPSLHRCRRLPSACTLSGRHG